MTTSGIERGSYLPFFGNGIAQSFGEIPLVASMSDDDGATELARLEVAARSNPQLFRAFLPWLGAAGDDFAPAPVVNVVTEDYWITYPPPVLATMHVALPFVDADQVPAGSLVTMIDSDPWLAVLRPPWPRTASLWQRLPLGVDDIAVPTVAPPVATPAPLISRLLAEQVRQSIKYSTNVLVMWNGLESRVSLTPYPRESVQFSVLLADADLRTMRALLFLQPETPQLLPMRVEETAALADITGTTIVIDSSQIDWPDTNTGWSVLVENFAGQSYVANVIGEIGFGTTTTTLTVDVSPPAGQTYIAGSHVIPLRSVYLDDNQVSNRYPVAAGVFQISGVVQPVRTTIGTGATVTMFDGLPVFDRRLNADQVSPEANVGGLQVIDGGAGGAYYTRTAYPQSDMQRRHTFVIKSIGERQWLRKFWQTVRGKQVAFLCPTWKPDLVAAATPGLGSTTLLINSTPDYVTTWFPSSAHRHLQLNLTDGTTLYVKVTAAVDNGNGTQSLTVSVAFGSLPGIDSISLLEQVRFDNDELAIAWQSTNGKAQIPMMVVQR